jgi:putative transposase
MRLRELALARPRFGYRRLHVLLRREGWKVNHKRVLRLYRLLELALRTKRRKRRAAETRLPIPIATRRNELWSLDFMSDQLVSGRWYRLLTVIDLGSRECKGILTAHSLPADKVTAFLDQLIEEHGKPAGLQLDNGTEFTSNHFDAWAFERGIALHFIRPGKPVDNAWIESFNGRLRDECLNLHWFDDVEHAGKETEAWRCDYNECRPHSSLGNLAPAEYAERLMTWAGH